MRKRIPRLVYILLICLQFVNIDAQMPVRMCAEWEPALGTLIRWPLGIPSSLVVELAKDDSLYVVVGNQNEEDQAISQFSSWGVNLDHCTFIHAKTNTHWTRDWGPHYAFDENGIGGIVDAIFKGYPWVEGCDIYADISEMYTLPEVLSSIRYGTVGRGDDDVNEILAEQLATPYRYFPIYLTGGNIMTDGHHSAFSSEQMLNENSSICNEQEFKNYTRNYLGITEYNFISDPQINGIQHIDCYAKLLDEETILVKQVSADNPEYECCERLVDELKEFTSCYGRPYKILRILCGPYEGQKVTVYTNSLILNKKVLVPLYGISTDQGALTTFRNAMKGYEVIGFEYDSWYDDDALHCRTKAIYDCEMLRIWHKPLDEEILESSEFKINAMIDDRSEAGLIEEKLKVFWHKKGDISWDSISLLSTTGVDSFTATIPKQLPGTTVEYYISAADSSGRYETLPCTAPGGFYSFNVLEDTTTGIACQSKSNKYRYFTVTTCYVKNRIRIEFDFLYKLPVTLYVCDITGRRIKLLLDDVVPDGTIYWYGNDDSGVSCAPGVYMIVLCLGNGIKAERCIIR